MSNTRTPSYIGEVTLTELSIGNIPPCITGVRVLPFEMGEVWGAEVDIEYAGGALLGIETRLEVGDPDLRREIEDSNPDLGNGGGVSSDLIGGFEYLGKQLNLPEGISDNLDEPKKDGDANIGKYTNHMRSNMLCLYFLYDALPTYLINFNIIAMKMGFNETIWILRSFVLLTILLTVFEILVGNFLQSFEKLLVLFFFTNQLLVYYFVSIPF